jgi:hypothetical protein
VSHSRILILSSVVVYASHTIFWVFHCAEELYNIASFRGFPSCFFSLGILHPKDSATNTDRQKNLKHHILLYFTDPWRCSSSS